MVNITKKGGRSDGKPNRKSIDSFLNQRKEFKIMKKSKKIIALLLSLIMIICSLPMTAFAESLESLGELQADESVEIINEESTENEQKWYVIDEQEIISDQVIGNVVEVTSLREENVKHFRLSDGTYEAIVYAEPVHRKDKDGVWQEIDNTIELQNYRGLAKYETQDSRISFADSFKANSDIFTLNENGYSVSMSLLSNGIEDDVISTSPIELSPIPIVNNSSSVRNTTKFDSLEEAKSIDNRTSIVYNNIRKNTNIEYVLKGNDVKENIIVTAPCEEYEYVFQLNLSGLSAIMTENGEVLLKDADTDEIKYVIPAPYMYDANGVYSYDVSYTLEQVKDEIYLLAVTADSEWINSTDRAFPVVIDPTLRFYDLYLDSYIDSNYPDENFGYDPIMWVSNYCAAFVKIYLPYFPQGTTISTANLCIPYYYHITTGSLSASAYQVTESWSEGTITFNNFPDVGLYAIDIVTMPASSDITESSPGTVKFNITDVVKNWYNGTPNHGVMIMRKESSTSTNLSVILKSYEAYAEPTYMSINYTYYIPDGVYSFENVGMDDYWIKLEKSGDDDTLIGNSLKRAYSTKDAASSTVFDRTRLFKITRVGNTARYTIRSMLNNNISFGIANNQIIAKEIPEIDENVAIADTFFIEWKGDGFTISPCNTVYLLSLSNSSNDNILFESNVNSSIYSHWELSQYTDFERSGYTLGSYVNEFIVGEMAILKPNAWSTVIRANIPELHIESEYEDYMTLTWHANTNTAIADFLQAKEITIECNIYTPDMSLIATVSTIKKILPIGEGAYYIQNVQTHQYITEAGFSPTDGATICQDEYNGGTLQQWEIEYSSSTKKYVTIRSTTNDMYLGVDSEDSTRIIQYEGISEYIYWKLEMTDTGNYKIIPYPFESENKVLNALNDYDLMLTTYTPHSDQNTSDRDEWYLVSKVISIVNYFDASLENNETVKSYISEAVNFANLSYAKYYHIGIYMDGGATRKQTILDDCNCNSGYLNAQCTPSHQANTNCISYHHKNTVAISNDLYNSVPLENNHIYVLWTDRPSAYCKTDEIKMNDNTIDYQHKNKTEVALVYGTRPIIHFLHIPTKGSIDTKYMSMSITLVHEIAHVLGMGEPYEEIYGHDIEGQTNCVMEELEVEHYSQYYNYILSGDAKPFCDKCRMKMFEEEIIINGN